MPDVTRLAITHADTQAFSELAPVLNLHMHPPIGERSWWQDSCADLYTEIGQIIWTNTDGIHVHPYLNITEDDLDVLRGAALESAHTKPSTRAGWCRYTRNGRRGWVCTISTAAVPTSIRSAIRAAETRAERNGRLIRASADPL